MLPALVKGLKAQTHPIAQTVAVDTASRDRSGAVLAELIGQDAVFGMDRGTGYGEAVDAAIRRSPAIQAPDTLERQPVEWIWLLHDDCEPTQDALEQLLLRHRLVTIVGPAGIGKTTVAVAASAFTGASITRRVERGRL